MKIKDTKIGKFLSEKAPQAIEFVGDILPDSGGLGLVKNLIKTLHLSPEEIEEANRLIIETQLEYYRIDAQDRASARTRETELAKSDGTDWLMYATGVTGLASFIVMVFAVIWIPSVRDNDLFVHLMGIIEGVVITSLFAYYFGSSKSSSDKNRIIDRIK